MNAAIFALKKLQDAMRGTSEQAEWHSEKDLADDIDEMRAGSGRE